MHQHKKSALGQQKTRHHDFRDTELIGSNGCECKIKMSYIFRGIQRFYDIHTSYIYINFLLSQSIHVTFVSVINLRIVERMHLVNFEQKIDIGKMAMISDICFLSLIKSIYE